MRGGVNGAVDDVCTDQRERVVHRVGHRGGRSDRATLADALVVTGRRRRRFDVAVLDLGHVGRGGQEVVHERAS